MPSVSTVLGETREANNVYADGSYDCPFCGNPIITPKTECVNPMCDAYPLWNPERLVAYRVDVTRREREQQEEWESRERTNRWYGEWEQEQREEKARQRQDAYDKAVAGGYCLTCLFAQSWRYTYIRHRGTCPRKRTR